MSEQTLTRALLTEAVYKEIGLSQAESADLVDAVLDEMIASLVQDNEVKISSFGSFRISEKKARIGRNPKTKEEAVITPRSVVTFHASNILRDAINEGYEAAEQGKKKSEAA